MPTGLSILKEGVALGRTEEQVLAAMSKSLGYTVTPEMLSLDVKQLNAMMRKPPQKPEQERPVPEMSVDDRPSLFKPPEEGESFVEMVAEPAAKLAGIGAGAVKTAMELVSTRPQRSDVATAFKQTREQLAKESEYRLNKDVYDNWRANVADLSEGTIDLFLELADLKDKGSESTLGGMTRAFKEGMALPSTMVGGGAAFLSRLAEDPITTMRTHPADALLTVLPALPKVAGLAKAKNAQAIRAMKELEQTGLVRAATAVAEAPGKLAGKKIGNLKIKDRVVERLTDEGPVLAGGERALTLGDLAKSALKGAAGGLVLDEAALGAALAPALKVFQARFPKAPQTLFRRLFTDVAARDNARAEALLREAVLRPQKFAQELQRLSSELPDLIEQIDPSTAQRVKFGTKEAGTARLEYASGRVIPKEEKGLSAMADKGKLQPRVAQMPPDVAKTLDKMRVALKSGVARVREKSPRGGQIDKTDLYLTKVGEVLTGETVGLLNDNTVYELVKGRLVGMGRKPREAGELLRRAANEWDRDLNPVILTKVKGADGKWKTLPLESVIRKAVSESPKAQRSVLDRTMGMIARDEAKNQRVKIVADTANPVFDIYQERWAGKPENKGKTFAEMVEEDPSVYQDMWAKMYELERGLVDGAPVMFLPFKDIAPFKLRRQLREGEATQGIVDRILEKHPDLSPEQVERGLDRLQDKIFNFKKVDDLGGHIDPGVSKVFGEIDAAEKFRDAANKVVGGWVSRQTQRMKKFLTVLNISSGINNITANVLLQSITRGTPMSAVVKDLAATGMDYRKYKNKGDVGSDAAMMYRSLEDTGVLDNDMIAVETNLYKGESLGSKLAKPFETFYRQGDALPKLDESVRVYKKTMQDLGKIADGESVTMLVDSNKAVKLRREGGNFVRDGKAVTGQQLSDIVARGAAMAAENKFFNYNDTGALTQKIRGSNAAAVVSPFYTWFSKALAGRRGGLVGNVLMGEFSPIVSTDSVSVLRAQLADAAMQSGRRAMFSQVGDFEDRAMRDAYRDVASYHVRKGSPLLMDAPDRRGATRTKSLEFVDFSGPFSLGLRQATGLLAMARGDTDSKNLLRLQAQDNPASKRRASLALKQLRGERLNGMDTLELIGLSGGPALELIESMKNDFKDKYGRPISADKWFASFGSALLGGTLAKGIQTALAVGPETGVFGELPEGVKLDPDLRETAMSFAVRRILGLAPTPMKLIGRRKSEKGDVDYYLEQVEDTLIKETAGELRRRAKKLQKAGRKDKARELLLDAKRWDGIIKREVRAETLRLNRARRDFLK